MKFEGVCIIQESGFGFKFRIPYDSCTHECNSYHAGVLAVNPWQYCSHVHTSFSSNSVWQNYWNSSNRSAFTVLRFWFSLLNQWSYNAFYTLVLVHSSFTVKRLDTEHTSCRLFLSRRKIARQTKDVVRIQSWRICSFFVITCQLELYLPLADVIECTHV